MNFIEAIKYLQDFRSQLETWGVTNGGLVLIGVIALILFMLSAREVVGWFLKTHQLRDEIRDLRSEVIALQKLIEGSRDMEAPGQTGEKKSAVKADGETATGSKLFRLDH